MESTQLSNDQNRMRSAHSERQWPPRSFVLSVRARIAQGQREEAAGRVEGLAGRAQRGQAGPALRLSATGQTTPILPCASRRAVPRAQYVPHARRLNSVAPLAYIHGYPHISYFISLQPYPQTT